MFVSICFASTQRANSVVCSTLSLSLSLSLSISPCLSIPPFTIWQIKGACLITQHTTYILLQFTHRRSTFFDRSNITVLCGSKLLARIFRSLLWCNCLATSWSLDSCQRLVLFLFPPLFPPFLSLFFVSFQLTVLTCQVS